jgi:hypothetical protein
MQRGKQLVLGLRLVASTTLAIAAAGALVGFLVGRFAVHGRAPQSVGWGMCIAGALVGLVAGQSGSPSRMAVGGRTGFFGTFWGRSAALPQSPLWVLAAGALVMAGGVALVILTY